MAKRRPRVKIGAQPSGIDGQTPKSAPSRQVRRGADRGKAKATTSADRAEDRKVKKFMRRLAERAKARRFKPGDRTPFDPPEFPPGVVPPEIAARYKAQAREAGENFLAMDSSLSTIAAWGAQSFYNGAFQEGVTFLGYAYLAQLAQRPEYRRIVETIAVEMTRKWIKLQVVAGPAKDEEAEPKVDPSDPRAKQFEKNPNRLDPIGDKDKTAKLKQLGDFLDNLHVRDRFRELAEQDGFFGRAHLYLDTGDTDDHEELLVSIGDGRSKLSKAKVRKSRPLKALRTVEAVWTYPANYNSNDPLKADWYNPQTWFVQGKEVHVSRLIKFVGREVPDLLKPAYAFGGLSMTQMAKPYVDNWLRTRTSVSNLVSNFSTRGLKTDLGASITDAGDDLFARIDFFTATSNNDGLMVLQTGGPGEGEEFFNITTPLGSLDLLQAQAQEHMASVSGIPLVKLLKVQPAGLNASSEGEVETFDDDIGAYQEKLFRDPLTTVIGFAQLSLWNEIDPAITFIFEPLQASTPKEKAEIRKIEAETDGVLINDCNSLSPEESRKRIAADPDTPYASLDVDDMPEPRQPEGGEGGEPGAGGDDGNEPPEPGEEDALPAPKVKSPEVGKDATIPFVVEGPRRPKRGALAQDEFTEADHPRGQPGNAGQFGSGGGGGGGKPSAHKTAPARSSSPSSSSTAPLKMGALKQVSGKLGSNPGGVYEAAGGKRFYVKAGQSADHVRNELIAGALYNLAGAPTLKYQPVEGGKHIATQWQEKSKDSAKDFSADELKEAQGDFAVHAWLGNWDAAGLDYDNQAIIDGRPTSVDLGGAMEYRAQGAPKGQAFGTSVGEWDSLRSKDVNPQNAKLFGAMTAEQLKASASKVTQIPDAKIAETVKAGGGSQALADKLIARKADIAKRAGVPLAQDERYDELRAVHIGNDEWVTIGAGDVTIAADAAGDFEESKHPRAKGGEGGGQFVKKGGEGAGGGAGKEEPVKVETFKSKKDHVAHLLTKGTTAAEVLAATGWPSVSMPAQAKAAKMHLVKFKEGGVTKYKGVPIEAGKPAPEGAVVSKPKAAPTAPIDKTPITTVKGPAGQGMEASVFKNTDGKSYNVALKDTDAGQTVPIYKTFPTLDGAIAGAHEILFGKPKTPPEKKHPPATPDELKKAAKGTKVPTSSSYSPAANALVEKFNKEYEGKTLTDKTALEGKVAAFKTLQAGVKAANEGYAAQAAAAQQAANAAATAKLKAAQEATKAKNKKYMDELGISETQATGFNALVDMMSESGASSKDVVEKFKAYEAQAEKLGYPITGFQYALIRNYIDGGYHGVNSALRSGSWTVAQNVYAMLVNDAITKLPKYTGTVVRGASLEPSQLAIYQEGHVVEERAFTSTGVGYKFDGNVHYTIKAIGKRGGDFSTGANTSEKEVLFKAHTYFLVHKVTKDGDVTHIEMEEVEGHG